MYLLLRNTFVLLISNIYQHFGHYSTLFFWLLSYRKGLYLHFIYMMSFLVCQSLKWSQVWQLEKLSQNQRCFIVAVDDGSKHSFRYQLMLEMVNIVVVLFKLNPLLVRLVLQSPYIWIWLLVIDCLILFNLIGFQFLFTSICFVNSHEFTMFIKFVSIVWFLMSLSE